MRKEDFYSILYDWRNLIISREGIRRDIEDTVWKSIDTMPIKVITGFRRVGKSFLVQRIAKKAIENKLINSSNLLYLNFEDYRLSEVNNAKQLGELYEFFLLDAKSGKKLIVLDELQNIEEWEKFVRTLYEKEKDVRIIITGSNSQMLSSEISSNLSGRFIEYFVLPFGFKEFLQLNNMNISRPQDYFTHRIDVLKQFETYLTFGGLPEVLLIPEEEAKLSYLKGILGKVILDDVVKRFKLDNVDLVERITAFILSAPGQIITFTSIKKKLKNLGLEVKAETVIKYINCLSSTFAFKGIDKFSWKLSRAFNSAKKYYPIDNGITNLYSNIAENRSFRLETSIMLELIRRSSQAKIYYGKDEAEREIDFILRDKKSNQKAYQVCTEINQDNIEREISPFKFIHQSENYILTEKQDIKDLSKLKEYGIIIKPLVEFLLFE